MTFEELMQGFAEIKDILKRVSLQSEETDRRMQETDRRMQETDREMKETDREIKEIFKRMEQTEKQTMKSINALSDKWGHFVVGLVIPATKKMFAKRGIHIETVFKGAKSEVKGAEMEIDVLAVNEEYVIPIEVKSTLGIDDINEHVERLGKFKKAFKVYSDKKIIGAVAGIVINEGVDKYAYRKGLFVIGQSGETVIILNDDKFTPKFF
ncbi:MAG: hypothetical protein L3V56_05720 [Candidatus Magnetoovum sp. WYHC-5]|nr:hypothetical protein [Candidatus Magnetoovum sp. WYHC-5]